jgi:hypothetical protein
MNVSDLAAILVGLAVLAWIAFCVVSNAIDTGKAVHKFAKRMHAALPEDPVSDSRTHHMPASAEPRAETPLATRAKL